MSNLNNPNTMNGVTELGNLFLSVTGGAVFYVGTQAQIQALSDVGQGITSRTSTTVSEALGRCESGRGDVIYVLPGYTESIGAADAWSALAAKTDVTIIGMGRGTNRPAFTWTVTASSVLFDVANFRIHNCQLFLAGAHAAGSALTVTAPITVTAAGCAITDCDIFFGFDSDQKVTIAVTVTAGTKFHFKRNYCYGATAAECTSFLYLDGASFCQIYDNTIIGGTSSTTVGVVRFINNASVGIDFRRNNLVNMKAVSIHAVTQMAGVLGLVSDCSIGILDGATLAGWVPAGAGDGPLFFRCYTANLAGESGALTTPVST
jgi:hypothetical protein